MQPPLTYSWIALTASAPVILLLTTWTLAVFHCRRRQWSTIDIFLVSILSQSTVQQFLGFIYSTLVLLKLSSISTGDAVCTGMMWFFISIPIFKGTTITSLAVDRWLFYSKFSYRLSVRKNHIRYHIAVLAVLSCTVGFTALITFNNPELLTTTTAHHPFGSSQYSFDHCTFLPYKFDLKFVIFYLSAHLIIVLVGIVALCKVMCHKNKNAMNNAQESSQKNQCKRRRRRSLPLDLTPTLSNTSTASSSISNTSPSAFFSTPGLTAKAVLNSPPNNAYQLRNKMLLDFHDQNKKEEKKFYRMSTSIGLLLLTIICTHLPFTIATLLSRYDVLMPISTVADDQLSILNWPVTNIILWFQVFEGLAILLVLLIVDNTVPGWIFNRAKKCRKASTNTKLPQIQPNLNLRGVDTDLKMGQNMHSSAFPTVLNNRSNKNYHTNAAYTPDCKSNRFPITNGSLFAGLAPTPCTMTSQQQDARADRFHRMLDNPNLIQRLSRNDLDSFGQAFPEDDSEYDKKSYHQRYSSVASVTTVANDDFEFHHSRPYYQRGTPNEFNQSTYVVPKTQHIPKKSTAENTYKQPKKHAFYDDTETEVLPQTIKRGMLPPPTSLSMNDLDLIEDNEFKYCASSASNKPPVSVTGTEEYKHKRMYRKRSRIQVNTGKDNPRRSNKNFEQTSEMPHRRVLSMECLSPQTSQTDYRNFFDISYLDTGDILVRKADSSKCIFVTDFI